jgi:DNA polymerase I-like protein with 3'-5' exonuclease and polymerase domains
MYSVDCETSGLSFNHGCQTFAIGIYNGEDFAMTYRGINPETRRRYIGFGDDVKTNIRSMFESEDLIAIHNSEFDIKALVEAGIFHKDEPTKPEFWKRIVDTTILSHLHHNTDARGLKELTPQYLDRQYLSENVLDDLVKKCRMFVKKRKPTWRTASDKCPELKPLWNVAQPRWHKSDMWLPYEVSVEFPAKELLDYGIDPTQCEEAIAQYLKDDCINTYELAECLMQSVIESYDEDVMTYLEVNNQLLHVIYKMEMHGINIHEKEITEAIHTCNEWIKKLTADTERIARVKDITDNKLRKILFEDMGLESEKETKSGLDSVDAATLIKLKRAFNPNDPSTQQANEFLTKMMALKKYEKKLGYLTNFDNARITSTVHPSFFIVGTDTLRMSAKNPPLQTVSKATNPFEDEFDDITVLLEQSPPLRSVFGPSEGRWWLCNDYSQLQLRIFAVATQEQDMIDAFARGWDAHDYTARKIFGLSDKQTPSKGQRRIAKNVNFGFIFGASPSKIESTAGMVGLWDTVCAMFPNAHDFIQYQKDLLKSGEPVRTLGGYPLDVPMKEVKWKAAQEKAAHAAVCYIVQGSEGEIVKRAMRLCDDYLATHYPAGHLCLQVHDELDFDMPARFPKKHGLRLKQLMEEAALHYGVLAPVECEITTRRWNETKGVKLVI